MAGRLDGTGLPAAFHRVGPVARPARERLIRPALAVLLATGAALAGCGDDDDGADALPATGCGEVVRDRVDPGSAVHVLAGADDPGAYRTEPPTSGPHVPGAAPAGVLDEPLSRPEQVGHLEAGGILIQHGDLADDDLQVLAVIAGEPHVAVAPNPDLPAPIVATAWLHRLPCATADREALTAFVGDHRDRAPGTDG